MNADDYGFIDQTYKFVLQGGYKMDDLNPLYNNGFVIVFPNDAMLITDWFIHAGTTIRLDENRDMEYSYIHYDEHGRFIELDSLIEKRHQSKKQKAFIPPTLEEVKAYAAERKSVVDPVEFYNFFSTPNENGETWVDTKGQRVNNWKGKFVTWEKFRGGKSNGRNTDEAPARSSKWHINYDVDGRAEG